MSLFTIQKNVQTELMIEKSRFICTLAKAASEDEAAALISQIKKKYWDASHNCSAYIIGENMALQKSSDDGEPSGTAGIPMLEVLKKRDLHNVAAIVTRYFGGIKLGSGGLVRAYGKSVSQAVSEAGLCQKTAVYDCSFQEEPEAAGKVINMLYNQTLFSIMDIAYHENVTITIRVAESDLSEAKLLLEALFSRNMEFDTCEKKFIEVPVSGCR